jgi:hypothetical protein
MYFAKFLANRVNNPYFYRNSQLQLNSLNKPICCRVYLPMEPE